MAKTTEETLNFERAATAAAVARANQADREAGELRGELAELQDRYDQLSSEAESPSTMRNSRGREQVEYTPEALRMMIAWSVDPALFDGAGDVGERGDPFFFHRPSDGARLTCICVRRRFRRMRDWLLNCTPKGREQSLAITHLQDSMFHAICAVCTGDQKAVIEP